MPFPAHRAAACPRPGQPLLAPDLNCPARPPACLPAAPAPGVCRQWRAVCGDLEAQAIASSAHSTDDASHREAARALTAAFLHAAVVAAPAPAAVGAAPAEPSAAAGGLWATLNLRGPFSGALTDGVVAAGLQRRRWLQVRSRTCTASCCVAGTALHPNPATPTPTSHSHTSSTSLALLGHSPFAHPALRPPYRPALALPPPVAPPPCPRHPPSPLPCRRYSNLSCSPGFFLALTA
jgi:hypothetical protein